MPEEMLRQPFCITAETDDAPLRLPKWRDHLVIYPVSSCEFALNNLAIAILGPNSIGPDPFDPEVHHDLESTDQDRPVMGGQNERLNICSDALGDVIDAPLTGLSLTGCLPTEPAAFHPSLHP